VWIRSTAVSAIGILALTTIPSLAQQQQQYRFCLTEYERDCPAHDVYVYCTEDIKAKATGICKAATGGGSGDNNLVKLSDKPGTKCGVAMFQVICK
jgi:hypothetical protein